MTHTLLVCRCMIKYYTCEGVHLGEKITLRCTACHVNYNYTNYGEKHGAGFQYYTERRPTVKVSDTIYFDWGLLELQCSLV